MKFNVIQSNFAKVSADAVVLPANERLRETPGMSESVFKAAGRKQLQKACDDIGYCAVGSAVPTLAYKLNANYIIHTVVPKWIDGKHEEYALLANAYLSALQIADVMGCETAAIPLLTPEQSGFDRDREIAIAEEIITDFYGKNLKKIAFIIRRSHTENLYRSSVFTVLTYTKQDGVTKRLIDTKESTKFTAGNGQRFSVQIPKDHAQQTLAWFRAKENRSKIILFGIRMASVVLNKKPNKEKPKQ